MAAKWPRIFDTFAHRAFKAGEQPDGLQVPGQWVDLIGGIPNLSNTFYHHLFGQHERCLEYILSSVARVVLAILTVWPTSLTPTIERRRVYYKQATWNPDGMLLENLLWKKVIIDGVVHLKCNQRKFPVQLLRLALFTLGKSSQSRFPIKKFDNLLHINIAGVLFAKTHYSSLLMTTLW